jgi:hypothetical protein
MGPGSFPVAVYLPKPSHVFRTSKTTGVGIAVFCIHKEKIEPSPTGIGLVPVIHILAMQGE